MSQLLLAEGAAPSTPSSGKVTLYAKTDGKVYFKDDAGVEYSASITLPVAAADGGTGIASYAVGDIVYASATTTLSKLAGVATGNVLISGGVATAPSWGKVGLTTHVSGILGSANGGTGNDYTKFTGPTTSEKTFTLPDSSTTILTTADKGIGKQSVWIPAGAMTPRTTNGAQAGSVEMTTNKNMVRTLDFDAATQEFAQFDVRMPPSWNESTVTFIPVWSHASTATNFGVVWGLDAVAVSNDDTLDVAFGTEQTSADTGGTTNDSYQGPESSTITVAGSPAAGDLVQFRIHRNPSDGSDTMSIDARLHGVFLHYTTDAVNDA